MHYSLFIHYFVLFEYHRPALLLLRKYGGKTTKWQYCRRTHFLIYSLVCSSVCFVYLFVCLNITCMLCLFLESMAEKRQNGHTVGEHNIYLFSLHLFIILFCLNITYLLCLFLESVAENDKMAILQENTFA